MEKSYSESPTGRLALTWLKLLRGEWDKEVLGEMPEGVDPDLVRCNAEKAIEEIVGVAALDRFYHLEALNETDAEWFRWYTVGRFRYDVRAREKQRRTRWLMIAIGATLLAIAVHTARYLLGL